MEQLTIKELLKMCQEQVKKGNGNKNIIISNDDEGNGYHKLFYGFTSVEGFEGEIEDQEDRNPDTTVILG